MSGLHEMLTKVLINSKDSALSTIEDWAEKLVNVPVWAIHGKNDDIAPISNTQVLVNALEEAGGIVKFTALPDADHFILDVYQQKELYDWFLEHHK